jgi:hypothetical protein
LKFLLRIGGHLAHVGTNLVPAGVLGMKMRSRRFIMLATIRELKL